jgi:hypothetical protein
MYGIRNTLLYNYITLDGFSIFNFSLNIMYLKIVFNDY